MKAELQMLSKITSVRKNRDEYKLRVKELEVFVEKQGKTIIALKRQLKEKAQKVEVFSKKAELEHDDILRIKSIHAKTVGGNLREKQKYAQLEGTVKTLRKKLRKKAADVEKLRKENMWLKAQLIEQA